MFIACDFDGTIVIDDFPEIGAERKHVTDVLRRLHAAGHVLILWTCRRDQDERNYLTEAVEFCKSIGLDFHYINDNPMNEWPSQPRKVYAHVYLDDRALHVDDIHKLEGLLDDRS